MSCARGCCATYREHLVGVQWGNPSGPTPETLRERALDRDLTAFKEAAENGTRLKTFSGAADFVAQAQSQVEIDRGYLIKNPKLLREVEMHQASAPPPTTTPLPAES